MMQLCRLSFHICSEYESDRKAAAAAADDDDNDHDDDDNDHDDHDDHACYHHPGS